MRAGSEPFPLDLTPEEAGLGFVVERMPAGHDALVAHLPNGLQIVKTRVDGGVRYAICHGYNPIYADASSVEELRLRLGLARAS